MPIDREKLVEEMRAAIFNAAVMAEPFVGDEIVFVAEHQSGGVPLREAVSRTVQALVSRRSGLAEAALAVAEAALATERDHARQKVAEAYQVVGVLLALLGDEAFDSDDGQRALDYFSDCEGASQEDFLPWPREKLPAVAEDAIRADERERCAKVAEGFTCGLKVAAAIRTRPSAKLEAK